MNNDDGLTAMVESEQDETKGKCLSIHLSTV